MNTFLKGFEPWTRRFISELGNERRAEVLGFIQELKLKEVKPGTISRYVLAIRTLGKGKSYKELTREDLIAWLVGLKEMGPKDNGRQGYSESTLFLFKHHVKRFLKYCHNGSLASKRKPEALECICYRPPKRDFNGEILTQGEVGQMVVACTRQRDRALVFVGYESGARAGELLSLRIRDVQFDRYGAVIVVRGKTGARRIRLIQSVPDLQLWLNMHPNRENPDAPLWLSRRRGARAIGTKQLYRFLGTLAREAGLSKHVHPHLLRHTRATHLANVLTEAQMREYFGWTKRSEVPSIYVHLSGRDIDSTLLEHHGIKPEERAKEDGALKPVECPRCGFSNPAGAKFCNRCSMVLDAREARGLDVKLKHAEKLQEMFNRFMLERAGDLSKRFFDLPEVRRTLESLE